MSRNAYATAVDHKPSPHSRTNQLARMLWTGVQWILRYSPRRLFAVRAIVIRWFGGTLGRNTHIYPSCRIWAPWNLVMGDAACLGDRVDCYSVGRIELGRGVVISQDVVLCSGTHDYNDPDFPLITRPIRIENDAWIALGAFVGPGVTIGCGAVVGARAVVVRDVEPWTIVAGNPARVIGRRNRFSRDAVESDIGHIP
ncbi:MAG: hypothetical protein KDA81_18085 [Planctomycetaceae bacterium]|nr:hypothetical protein [Planctomycetaceae bacterium]MCA9085975.1 hypothetical protein [Planctomycetaceae bacterium]